MDFAILSHLAIIMDGNSRWAKAKNLPLIDGYHQGVIALKNIIQCSIVKKIKYLTVFAFSSENWSRDEDDVNMLMDLIKFYILKELPDIIKQGIRLNVIGNRENLTIDIQKLIAKAEYETQFNKLLCLTIALNYGSQQEILKVTKEIAQEVKEDRIKIENIDIPYFTSFLYTAKLPSLDLLIRTSGEIRLSNFLLWQASYAELYFTETLWPDFDHKELNKALSCYKKRNRRYGKSHL